jgi:hypothetical protein
MYLFVVDGAQVKVWVNSLGGMPSKGICTVDWTTHMRNMAIPGGASQVPAMALPHDEDARREFAYTNRFDFTVKGVVALVVISCAVFSALFVLHSAYWYLGLVVLAVVALVFFAPSFRNDHPQTRKRDSND